MTDHFPDNPDNDDLAGLFDDPALLELLANEDTWAETQSSDEDAIVAAIGSLIATQPGETQPRAVVEPIGTTEPASAVAPVTELSLVRRLAVPTLAGAAAAVAVIAGFGLVRSSNTTDADEELSLASTDLAPTASGTIDVFETPNGTRIVLDVSGLPPAPDGSYYEAWLRQDATIGVSAGTFHLRGGGGEVELWAGVTTDDYPLFTITIQDEAETESSGQVVLKGLLGE